jgi:hypothetical protein
VRHHEVVVWSWVCREASERVVVAARIGWRWRRAARQWSFKAADCIGAGPPSYRRTGVMVCCFSTVYYASPTTARRPVRQRRKPRLPITIAIPTSSSFLL